jgi:hypothetical protein
VSARPNLRRQISPRCGCGGKKRPRGSRRREWVYNMHSSPVFLHAVYRFGENKCARSEERDAAGSLLNAVPRESHASSPREMFLCVCIKALSARIVGTDQEKEHRRAIQLCAIHPSWLRSHFRRDQTLRRVLRMIKFNFINYPSSWRRVVSFAKAWGFNRP